jgi:hypothetical protein
MGGRGVQIAREREGGRERGERGGGREGEGRGRG